MSDSIPRGFCRLFFKYIQNTGAFPGTSDHKLALDDYECHCYCTEGHLSGLLRVRFFFFIRTSKFWPSLVVLKFCTI